MLVVKDLCSIVNVLSGFDAQRGVGAKCCDKILWLCAFDLFLEGKEGGSNA
jgi:hypothetical protein